MDFLLLSFSVHGVCSDVSFFILDIDNLYLFFLSLARELSLIDSENPLLILLTFFAEFLFSISVIATLIFIISFFCQPWGLIGFPFSSFLRGKPR